MATILPILANGLVPLRIDQFGPAVMTACTRPISLHRLAGDDTALLDGMLTMFGEAFDEVATYGRHRPGPAYVERLLGDDRVIALAACINDDVVAGLVAYVLQKFEQERAEVYIYDLAVAASHRRRGIATALIQELKRIATKLGAHVIFVQADPDDAPAIQLYAKLGTREDVLHFDIAMD